MKIYAQQTPPEYQESPLFFAGCFPENVYCFGNDRLNRHTTDFFDSIPQMVEDLADELESLSHGNGLFNSWRDTLNAYAPPQDRPPYTRHERKTVWVDIIRRWTETDEENTVFCDVLLLVTGKAYKTATIHGCTQGEWQHVIFPAEWTQETLTAFEVEYFNTGTEWEVKESEDNPGYIMYCTTNEPRKEIAEMAGVTPDDVILYAFDGWERTPKYKEVLS